MTSHDAYTNRTSRVITVASLQRLNLEALIPAPADCEVLSVIKFLNAQGIAPIEVHSYTSNHFSQISCSLLHKRFTEQLLSRKLCARWVPKELIPEHKAQCIESVLKFWSIFSYTSINSCPVSASDFRMTERRR